MIAIIAVGAALLTFAVWPELARRPKVPVHLLVGGGAFADAVPKHLVAAIWVTELVAVGATVALSESSGTAWFRAGVLVAVALGVRVASHRSPRACEAPMLEDAILLLVCATLVAPSIWPVLVGGITGTVAVAAVLAGQWAGWGRRPVFARSWRPWFRVRGNNPDTIGATAQLRTPGDYVVTIRDQGATFTSILVVGLGHGRVAGLDSDVLRPWIRREGRVRVHIGSGPPPPAVELSLALPEVGRWMVSVRDYELDQLDFRLAEVTRVS